MHMNRNPGRTNYFSSLMRQRPCAFSRVIGSDMYPDINGYVKFYQTKYGVLVSAEIFGLPTCNEPCRENIFAFHIHNGCCCSGNENDPFADAEMHYNPCDCEHPYHAGDLPPIFSNDGYAFSTFLTNRFSVNEIIGRTVIIHSNPDDFTTQPSGNAGKKIACGEIKAFSKC